MKESTLIKICFVITIIGIIALCITYKPEFERTTITNLLEKENSKGILYGRIDYVQKNFPITIFTLNDTSKALIYYPKPTTLEVNDFVEVYAEYEPPQKVTENIVTKKITTTQTLFAHKVVKK